MVAITRYIETLYLVFKHTKNPISVIFGYFKNKKGTIILKNGLELPFDRGSITLPSLIIFDKGWTIQKHKDGFLFKKEDIKLIQPNIGVLGEDMEKLYHVFDYKNATVLDVGGYFGETAVFSKKWGAKKVIIYEPVKYHLDFIKKNIKLNNVRAIIKEFAVSDKTGKEFWQIKETDLGSAGFGLKRKGTKKIQIKTKSWKAVLEDAIRSKVNIVKIDCEGPEKYLVDVEDDILEKIKNWIIEAHSKETAQNLKVKFKRLGFNLKIHKMNSDVSILYFFKA